MTEEDWDSGFGRSIAMFLNGQGIPDRDGRGQRVADDSFLLCFSAHDEAIDFAVPATSTPLPGRSSSTRCAASTRSRPRSSRPAATIAVGPRAIVVLRKAD